MIGTPEQYQTSCGPLTSESGMATYAREEASRQIVAYHGYPVAPTLIEAFWKLLDMFATEFGITRLEVPHVVFCWYLYLTCEVRARALTALPPLPV